MYHISDCERYMRCPRLYALELNAGRASYNPFVRTDEEVTSLAAEKLHVDQSWTGHQGDDPSLALEAYKHYEWLIKARFEYKGLRIKVPFLHHRANGKTDLYFLYVGLYPHADDMAFYDDMVWVLHGNGIFPEKIYIIHLNAAYEREKELDPQKLFIISDCFYNGKNHPVTNIKKAIYNSLRSPLPILKKMEEIDADNPPAPVRSPACSRRQKCKYYDECFKEEAEMPDDNILTLSSSQNRYSMLANGISLLKDADISQLEGNRMQYAEIMADKNGGLFVDHPALHTWLENIHFPISFLDFEWERYAIPPYEGMHPYDVMPFEYSLHVMQEDGTVTHTVYLNVHDDRYDMARHLIKDIPVNGSVIAYNAEGAEKLRIQEFADLFTDLRDPLLQINERMEDLQLPFVTGTVYDVRMRGQWSLKVIMNMMHDRSYQDLDIHQGMQAVFAWRHLDRNETDFDSHEISSELKQYCGMDSYAMMVILKWLFRLDNARIKVEIEQQKDN